ncbi:hypothetical protein JW865_06010 [Candidatus Bathyarchaeota archaeon]|nr:hypothetical protein [Candidatus Bathyarchaeota archaeon]
MGFKKNRSIWISGTALMAALAVVLDYALKYSGLKIQFPWMPMLKFDFTEIPIIMSYFLYGVSSAVITSCIVFVGMLMRSSDLIGAIMKIVAELSTIFGLIVFSWIINKLNKISSFQFILNIFMGIIFRIIATSITNFYVLPNYYQISLEVTLSMLPLIAVFNTLQGFINLFLGYVLFNASKKRLWGL